MTNKLDKLFEGALPLRDYCKSVLAHGTARQKSSLLDSKAPWPVHFVPVHEYRKVKEPVIQKEIRQYLEKQGAWVHKAKSVNLVGKEDDQHFASTDRGVPDLLCSFRGYFFAIEVKAARKGVKLSPDQVRQLNNIRSVGSHALCAHSVRHVERYLIASEYLSIKPDFLSFPMFQTKDHFVTDE